MNHICPNKLYILYHDFALNLFDMLEVFPVSELSVFGVVREFVNSSHFMQVKLKGVFGRGI